MRQAIESALYQTRSADEIIISDDNSTDNSLAIARSYEPRVKVFTNSAGPSGFVNGWNNAIAHATGDYISILHQDDLLAPEFLEEIEKAAIANPDVMHIVTPCNYIDVEGKIIRESTHLSGETRRYTGTEYADIYIQQGSDHINRCPGVVDRRDLFDECRYREEAGHIADDDFFMRVGNYTDIVCIHRPLAFYREHKSSETGHLKFLQLNLRLLHDHAYQIEHFPDNSCISPQSQEYLRIEENKYIRRILIRSLQTLKLNYSAKAFGYLAKATIRDKGKNLKYLFKKH